MLSDWYHEEEGQKVWWRDDLDGKGLFLFSFDRKKTFNLFEDYPHNLTEEQRRIFDAENPYWVNFFTEAGD